ncbi:MAG: phosphotransferase [Chitinophagaceae bacterium]|nr:phosphotransferase [Chitinophagaceae bacterium]
MEEIIKEIRELFEKEVGLPVSRVEKLPQSGSDRIYFRVHSNDNTFIATYGRNTKENSTFIYFSKHFRASGCPVPEILAVNASNTIYLQEDFGDISLLNKLDELGYTEEVFRLFQQSLKQLAHLQIKGDQNLDYQYCITSKEFGKQAILSDLLYFKYYFLDTLQIPYDKEKLLEEFDALATFLTNTDYKFFMFRDFQSRNIMIKDDQVHYIDFQGGMKGALQYDVASMLWQARAELPEEWKNRLLNFYIDCAEEQLGTPINRPRFISQYNGYVLIRLLQVLGAYGFRGLFERKAHFLTSIPLALNNLKSFLTNQGAGIEVPEFGRLLNIITGDEVVNRFRPAQANEQTPLVVHINSFSYKNGIPPDISGNGGGFVFDCRGLLNPGRFEEYKKLTGRDKSVQDFLEQRTKMADFLNSIFTIVDISVEDYIKRGFSDLQVSFGCTGGQHRSVFAADSLARHLKNKFKVKIKLSHVVQDAKNWINT